MPPRRLARCAGAATRATRPVRLQIADKPQSHLGASNRLSPGGPRANVGFLVEIARDALEMAPDGLYTSDYDACRERFSSVSLARVSAASATPSQPSGRARSRLMWRRTGKSQLAPGALRSFSVSSSSRAGLRPGPGGSSWADRHRSSSEPSGFRECSGGPMLANRQRSLQPRARNRSTASLSTSKPSPACSGARIIPSLTV